MVASESRLSRVEIFKTTARCLPARRAQNLN
jgi:hypothetical protein